MFVGWLSSTKLENAEITIRIVDCTPALVPRRSDLAEAGGLRQVPAEDGQKFAAELGVPFLEASAKTGEYVDTAFLLISSQVSFPLLALLHARPRLRAWPDGAASCIHCSWPARLF
mgnify:CR=1 FL=1